MRRTLRLMRVALVDPSLFTLPYDAALAGGLRGEGHDVVLYGRAPVADENSAEGVHLVPGFYRVAGHRAMRRLPERARLAVKGVDHLGSMLWLWRRLHDHPADIIHFQWLPLPAIDRHFLKRLGRLAPLVLTVHDTNPFNGNPSSGLQGLGMADSFRSFDQLIVHTARGRERLLEQGLDGRRVTVMPHGLLGPTGPAVAADPMDATVTFTVFGKIKPYKGIDVLIEAFSRIPAPLREHARLRVVGKPYMDLAPLRALAAERGVDAGLEPRFVADDEIPHLFGPGTVATFPYREIEASGVLTLALANGRPILATRIGGFAETIAEGVQGLLVEPDQPASLAAAMTRFLEDRAFAAACARNVVTLAAAVPAWPDIARRTVEIYLKANPSGPRTAGARTPAARQTA